MKDIWTEEPTRVHQYAQPAAGSGQGIQREYGDAHESSTVIENRDSLLARVSASMAVPESGSAAGSGADPFRLPGMNRTPVRQEPIFDLPVSRDSRRSSAGVIQTFQFGHDDESRSADLTPPPIQTRSRADRPATGDAHRTVRPRGRNSGLGPHLPITIGIVASFVVGMALNREPPREQAPAPLRARAAAVVPLIQPRLAAPAPPPPIAVVPARAMLKITSSPAGAYVAVDNEVGPGPTPREVAVELDRWVTVTAQRPGFRPTSTTVFVQQATTEIEIPLEADQSDRPVRRR
jgi:hypothetical protein